MQTVKTFLWGPSPEQQVHINPLPSSDQMLWFQWLTISPTKKAKCNTLVRQQTRNLDRDIQKLRQLETKTRGLIKASATRAQKAPATSAARKQASAELKAFAKELLRIRKQSTRLYTSKATLASVGMQVNSAFAMRKVQGSIAASTKVMRDVNTLVRLPALSDSMRELSQELMKAGIIEEMVDDSLFADQGTEEDDEAEEEIEKVLGEVLREKLPAGAGGVTGESLGAVPDDVAAPVAAEQEVDQEEIMAQMRGRLEALKS